MKKLCECTYVCMYGRLHALSVYVCVICFLFIIVMKRCDGCMCVTCVYVMDV